MNTTPYIPVQMKLKPDTIEEIETLQRLLKTENKTAAIKQAIEVTNLIAEAIAHGGNIVLEESNGTRSKLIIPTLEKARRTSA